MITHVRREGDKLIVSGTTSDNGEVKEVIVSGTPAQSRSPNFADWEATVPIAASEEGGRAEIRAHAIDQAGNTEPREHVVTIR